jgi:hypothetical protein
VRALIYSAAFIVLLATLPAQAEIYRWVDENGRTHFSDRAPPQGSVDAQAQNADPAPQAITEFAPSPANFIPNNKLPTRSELRGLPEKIRPGTPGVTDVFFLGFAGDARQGVFMRETLYAKKLFERQYDAQGRAFALVNHSSTDGHFPHASIDNLGAMLIALGKAMDDEDVLFLYLTSHGSKDHELVIEMPPQDYRWLSAPTLRRLLDAAGIRYRILVVSACYSGGFVPALRGPATVVATAADALNTSFGCSDANAFTWYGKALFERQMSQGTPIMAALHEARNIVREMEANAGYEHSNPQLEVGDEIQAAVTRLEPGAPTSASSQ